MKFSIIQNIQPLYNLGGWPEPDLDWVYIDKSGHTHKWIENKLPSLEELPAITEWIYCDCCDGYENTVEPAYYRCFQCLEIIEPKYKINTGAKYIISNYQYYIDDKEIFKSEFDRLFLKESKSGSE